MQGLMESLRVALTLTTLTYTSWSDYKTREVDNNVWILFAPPAFALTFAELLLYNPSMLGYYGLCIAITSAFATILFYAGGFGGADAKALMCLALAIPSYPEKILSPYSGEISPFMSILLPLTIFSNAVILAALTALYILIHNIVWRWKTGKPLFEDQHKNESIGRKILVLLTGYKVPIDKVKSKWYLYPLEDINRTENEIRRKLLIYPKDEDRNAIIERLEEAVKKGEIQEIIWATLGLPMLIFITIGLLAALLYGDIVWNLIRFLLK
jgi:preflagellin peptidase FlaK